MTVKAESVQERGLMSAGMSGTAAAHGEAVEPVKTEKKKARRRPDDGIEFCGVRRTRSGKYGAQIWDRSRRAGVWLGTFGTADEAAGAFDAAAVELRGAAAKTNFKSPAAVRSSARVTVVKEETGMSAGNGETAEEHGGGVEAAARRKKRALPDAQNKFEIVHKYYYKRRKDSRAAGRDDGSTNRFFQQLEALHGPAGLASPVATSVGVPGVVGASAVWPLAEPPSVGAMAGMATPVVGSNLGFATSKSNTENYANEEVAGTGSGEMMRLLEGLMKQDMQQHGAMMQQRFLEAIEKPEQDRMIREEEWRRQEMARLAREQEILAQERAVAATRDAAVLSFIQKITGQSISMPPMPLPPPSSQTHATQVAYAAAPPPAAPQPLNSLAPARLQSQQQQALVVHQSSTDIVTTPAETPHDASGYGGSGGGGGATLSSRWAKAEVHALIQLRNNLEMRRKGARGPLWEEIAAGMRQMGYGRSSAGCRKKWWNMTYYFKKVKESNKKLPDESKTCPYFHQFEALYRDKAALGSPSGAALPPPAAERANAAPQDRIEAFAVSGPILQMAPRPHTRPPVAKSGVHGVGSVSVGTQMLASNGGSVASNRFVFSDAGGHAADVHPRVATGGAYMWYPAPIANDINPEHVQEIVGLGQAPVAAIRRTAAARSDSRSGYRGVRLYGGRYIPQIRLPGRPTTRLRLGTFDDVEEAARAYDAAALMLYGAKAKTNFEQPPTGPAADDLPELPVRSSIISAPPASGGRVPQGDGLHVTGVSGGTQMQASNRFVFSEESTMDLLNDSPEPPVGSSTITVGAELEEFLKAFTDMVV